MGLSTTYTKTETDFLIQQLEKKTASGYKGDLRKSDPAPTQIGFYGLLETGVYTNLGGIAAQSGELNFASFNGTTWSLIGVEVTNSNFVTPIDNLTSTSTTSPLSAKQGKILKEGISNLKFIKNNSGTLINVPHQGVETIATVSSFTDSGENISITCASGTSLHSGKVLLFSQDIVEIKNLNGIDWITFGNKTDGSYIAIYVKNDSYKGSIGRIQTDGIAGLTGIKATINFNPDTTKAFRFEYQSTNILVYNNDVLWTTISKSAVGFNAKRIGCSQAGKVSISFSFSYYIKQLIQEEIFVESILIGKSESKSNYTVVFDGLNFKIQKKSQENKIITLYGDSITVAYDSDNYVSGILSKTGASVVNKKGVSGQSFSGQLQLDANIATITATNPDVVVIHSVNDHRTNATIGTMADASGTASLYGGLKKICNALISYNKNIKIVLCTPLIYGQISTYPASDVANSLGKYLHDYANAMKDFASNYGITIVDLSQKCCFRPQIEATTNRVYTSDGVHPNATGYEVMTTLIAEEINKLN